MVKLKAPLVSALLIPLLSTTALAQDWVVNKVSGKAWLVMGEGAQPKPLTAGMTVPAGATVQTSENARAMLLHGKDAMVVGPKSAIAMQAGRGAQTTTVLQRSGQITLEVETQHAPHFTVETPFMAAVVKGTKFDVRVSARDANVSVQQGRVQVADHATGQTADITPGQRAGVRLGKAGLTLAGRGPMPAVQSGTPRPALVPPVGQANVIAPASTPAKSSDAGAAGFGPGRSWSASAAVENRGQGRADAVHGARGIGAAAEKADNGKADKANNGNKGGNGGGNGGNGNGGGSKVGGKNGKGGKA